MWSSEFPYRARKLTDNFLFPSLFCSQQNARLKTTASDQENGEVKKQKLDESAETKQDEIIDEGKTQKASKRMRRMLKRMSKTVSVFDNDLYYIFKINFRTTRFFIKFSVVKIVREIIIGLIT